MTPSVIGVVIPLSANPVPLMAACVISTLAPPLFVRVKVSGSLLPTVRLGNVSLLGSDDKVPCDEGPVHDPESESVS